MSAPLTPAAPPLPPGVQELVLAAEVHAASVSEALQHFEAALSELHSHVHGLALGSPSHTAAVAQFRQLLTTAEQLKQQVQADPPRAEYSWRQRQAQRLADQVCRVCSVSVGRGCSQACWEQHRRPGMSLAPPPFHTPHVPPAPCRVTDVRRQAVAADAAGRHIEALDSYAKLLETLNRCHALETAPGARAAIMQRFQVRRPHSLARSRRDGHSLVTAQLLAPLALPLCIHPHTPPPACLQLYLERAESLRRRVP
jgi:hypothetical protein